MGLIHKFYTEKSLSEVRILLFSPDLQINGNPVSDKVQFSLSEYSDRLQCGKLHFYSFYGFPVIHANSRLRDNNGCIVSNNESLNDVL